MKHFYVIILLMFFGCKDRYRWPEKSEFKTITVNTKDAKAVHQSTLFDKAEFFKLESNDSILMKDILKLVVTPDRYFFMCSNGVFQFSLDGEFLGKISKSPSGIRSFAEISVDTVLRTIQVYDNSNKEFFIVDYNGNISQRWKNNLDGYSATKINDELSAIYIGASYYNEIANHKLNFVNKSGQIVNKYFPISEHETKFMHFGDLNNFPITSNQKYFQYSFNDTVYSITATGLTPRYFIDFANNRVPDSVFQENYNDVRDFYENLKHTHYSFRVNGFQESHDLIFFSFASGQRIIHAYYQKQNESIVLVDEIVEDLVFGDWKEKTNFVNLPIATNGNYFYQLLEPFALKRRIDSLKVHLGRGGFDLYRQENTSLLSLYDSISVTDNPILVRLNPK